LPQRLKQLRKYSVDGELEHQPDQFTANEERHQKLKALQLKNDQARSDQTDRQKYSERIFLLAINWIVIVMAILLADGCVPMSEYFEVSDSVMVTLIGATTATVLGLFAFVMKYLFYRSG